MRNIISRVSDQLACSCGWAFNSTQVYNDRLCIDTDGSFPQLLFVEDTIHVLVHTEIFLIVTVMDVMVDHVVDNQPKHGMV